MDEVKNDPLESLRQEWELEKSPRLTLQLAEEHGRQQDFLSAITVLRTGLARHPRHLASQVLLARYLVELEQWPEARETLERVASADPTHLIANKLLVKTHLATGELDEARNRLDLYTLLNESDPDIEELERALVAAPEPSPPEPSALPAGETVGDVEATEAVSSEPEAEPEEEGGPSELAAPPPPAPEPVPAVVTGREPFGDLFGAVGRERVVEEPPAGEIFRLGRPVVAPTVEPREEPVVESEPAAEPEPLTEPEPPTVSLGHLYLQQGHSADAERAFLAVLERDPGNVAARVGLAAARGAGNWAVSALDLVSRDQLASAGPMERKRAVLSGYLERLRAGGPATG